MYLTCVSKYQQWLRNHFKVECLNMTQYKFKITVSDEEAGSQPLSEQDMIDYIVLRLQSQSVIQVNKVESVGV